MPCSQDLCFSPALRRLGNHSQQSNRFHVQPHPWPAIRSRIVPAYFWDIPQNHTRQFMTGNRFICHGSWMYGVCSQGMLEISWVCFWAVCRWRHISISSFCSLILRSRGRQHLQDGFPCVQQLQTDWTWFCNVTSCWLCRDRSKICNAHIQDTGSYACKAWASLAIWSAEAWNSPQSTRGNEAGDERSKGSVFFFHAWKTKTFLEAVLAVQLLSQIFGWSCANRCLIPSSWMTRQLLQCA